MTYKPDPHLEAWLEAKLAERERKLRADFRQDLSLKLDHLDGALRAHIAGQERGLKSLIDSRLKLSTDHGARLAALAVLVEELASNAESTPAIQDKLNSLQDQINLLRLDLKREVERTSRAATSAQIARLMRKAEKKG